jgi:transposase
MQAAPTADYKSLYEASQLRIVALEQQLAQLQKMIFGSRHERFVPAGVNPSQLSLDIQAEAVASCSLADAKKITYTRSNALVEKKPLVHPGRMKLPEHLRREEILIEPEEDSLAAKRCVKRSPRCWSGNLVNSL